MGYLISILAISYPVAALRGIELRPWLVNKKGTAPDAVRPGRNTNGDSVYCRVFFHLESFFVNISDVLHNMFIGKLLYGWTVCRPMFVGLAESWSCRKDDANTKWLCFLVHVLCGDNLQTKKTLVLVLTHNKVHDTLGNLYYEVTQTCQKRTQEK